MKRTLLSLPGCFALLGVTVLVGSMAIADAPKNALPALPEMKLPRGWTMEDMQACMKAGTPGKIHQKLVQEAGTWHGKSTMWMGPGGEPMTSECTSTVAPLMDGRFTKVDMEGEMPGMGPYHGMGIYGFDNVSQQLVSTWIDNHGTGIMHGVGTQSADGKTITWKYTFNCPITKKPAVLREVDTMTGPNAKTMEMFGADPKSGKEYKMMRIEFTKK